MGDQTAYSADGGGQVWWLGNGWAGEDVSHDAEHSPRANQLLF